MSELTDLELTDLYDQVRELDRRVNVLREEINIYFIKN